MVSDMRKAATLSKPERIAMLATSVARVLAARSELAPKNREEAMKAVLKREVGKVMRMHPNLDITAFSDAIKAMVDVAGDQGPLCCGCIYP